LRKEMSIPVWHDDQQGTATVLLAGLLNALKIVGKRIDKIKIAMIGVGAANVATYRLLKATGVSPASVVTCDSKGVLHRDRHDVELRQTEFADKWRICSETNGDNLRGCIQDALRDTDVCIAFARSDPHLIKPEWVNSMRKDAIVFACSNPCPEIWPWDAREAGARIVGTGRGDFPNQVNNALGFPAIFRGTLDVRARTITDEMALAAAQELAAFAEERGTCESDILPRMDEWAVIPRVAAAVALKAQEQGLARLQKSKEQLPAEATQAMQNARSATRLLMDAGVIPPMPER
jgi:malate dehydrogenase (oxaloacetate-decarboxylating)